MCFVCRHTNLHVFHDFFKVELHALWQRHSAQVWGLVAGVLPCVCVCVCVCVVCAGNLEVVHTCAPSAVGRVRLVATTVLGFVQLSLALPQEFDRGFLSHFPFEIAKEKHLRLERR